MRRYLDLCTYDRSLTALLFLAITLACGLTPIQTDTWWQLRAGRDIWQSGHVLLTDVYSHTASGGFWPNHEWLAEIAYFLCYRLGGLPLVTLFAAALVVGGWSISWTLTRGSTREAFVWMALSLVPASRWWEPRPHAFSLLFLPLTVALIVRGRTRWLPLVFLVWANCHGGALLGLVVVGVGLTAQVAARQATWQRAGATLTACALAMTATPLGARFWVEIPRSLQRIHLYPLDEWRRPGLLELPVLPFWLIGAAFCAELVRHARRLWTSLRAAWRPPRPAPAGSSEASACAGEDARDLPVYACAALLLPMAVIAIRNVGPFLMLAVPAITSLRRFDRARASVCAPERPLANAAIVVVSTVAVVATLVVCYAKGIEKLRWAPVPGGALAALHECPDNLYNRYDEGGYLLWFAPGRKVFLDGRQDPYPPALILEHIAMETGHGRYESVFGRFGIHCAYLPTASPVAVQLSAAGWAALYRDPQWVVLTDGHARGTSADGSARP